MNLSTILSWLADALGLPFGIKVQNPRPLDAWRGPYNSVADAVATVPAAVRWQGMDVVVNGKRYVWSEGTADNQLVLESGGGGGDSEFFEDNGSVNTPATPMFWIVDLQNSPDYSGQAADLPYYEVAEDKAIRFIPLENGDEFKPEHEGQYIYSLFFNEGQIQYYITGYIYGETPDLYQDAFVDQGDGVPRFTPWATFIASYVDAAQFAAHKYYNVKLKDAESAGDVSTFRAQKISTDQLLVAGGIPEASLDSSVQTKLNRSSDLPAVVAANGNGALVYSGSSINAALTAVNGGAGSVNVFRNVTMSANASVAASTIVNFNGNILTLGGFTLTLDNRAQLLNCRSQSGTISSSYTANDALTPILRGGALVTSSVALTGGVIILENVLNFGSTAYATGTGQVILRGYTRANGRPTTGVTVVDERTVVYSPSGAQAQLTLAADNTTLLVNNNPVGGGGPVSAGDVQGLEDLIVEKIGENPPAAADVTGLEDFVNQAIANQQREIVNATISGGVGIDAEYSQEVTVPYDTVQIDTLGSFDIATHKFTAQHSGYYGIYASASFRPGTDDADNWACLQIYVNNGGLAQLGKQNTNYHNFDYQLAGYYETVIGAGQTVEIKLLCYSTGTSLCLFDYRSKFFIREL